MRLVRGLGVEGDAHAGETVRHRSRVANDSAQPNLRQVHLLHAELLDQLTREGFSVAPGQLGENVTTLGLALLDLPTGALLHIGERAVVEVTGLRNPCGQIDIFRPGLLRRLARKQEDGTIERLAGIMGVVRESGEIRLGDPVVVELPAGPLAPLVPV